MITDNTLEHMDRISADAEARGVLKERARVVAMLRAAGCLCSDVGWELYRTDGVHFEMCPGALAIAVETGS